MLESYIRTGDGKEYVDVDCVREALGIVDEYVDIFGEIKKLKEERDQLKEKCDKLKKRANAVYGTSCGKEPAFLCDVISYSWSFGAIDTPFPNNSIRVELNLTPTANYKGTFDLEDLKKYIQAYGREKKLGIVESVDYQNAKVARAELAYLYKTVLGKERLDPDLSPHEVMKSILDEYKRVRDSRCDFLPCESPAISADFLRKEFKQFCEQHKVAPLAGGGSVRDWIQYIFETLDEYRTLADEYRTLANNNFNKAEGFRKEKRAVEDSLAELRAKVREIYRSVVDDEWDEHLSYTSAMNDINEEYKRVVHNFEERTADWSKAQQELDRYRLAVGSLLDIPKESRDDINAIERSFNLTNKKYVSLKEFRNDVCEILDIPSSMADDHKQVRKEIHDFADRYYELRDFRADICEVLDIGADELFGSPQQNDKYILEQVEKLKDICVVVTHGCDHIELRKAIWEAMDRKPETLPDENARLVGEVAELARGEKLLVEFRDDVAKAIGMDYPTTNQVILNNVKYIYKDREDAYGMVSKLNDQVTALEKAKKDLQQMLIDSRYGGLGEYLKEAKDILGIDSCEKDAVAKAVKDLKSAYNNLHYDYDEVCEGYAKLKKDYDELGEAHSSVLKWNNSYAEVRRLLGVSADADADEMVDTLDQLIADRERCKRRYENWYSRYESEHERANGEHKRAEKLRKDVTALSNHIELLKLSNASQANSVVASQAFKNECRKLKEEKTKVIAALGQDIWDDCLK